jgi:hypothetical protein
MTANGPRRLEGELLTECAGWIWEQMQEEGYMLAGELVELVLETERELAIQGEPLDTIAARLDTEFVNRGISASPAPFEARLIRVVLEWEDEFLGFAGIPRAES